ncbi:hypothetical protein [Marinicella gelatinilytica]|uniref:hypothetical protein n=1 Tax=Marinicella gelatinilytica TaxID=2996017 RepID=UPI002260B162|nr:hypothetical protein [Marinicella gelatinilytica]MCX7546189.1 hypothetical protein [Marinicella gelatinilytica]
MNQMYKYKRQRISVNDTTFDLITRLDSEHNDSIYHQNKRLSLIEIKGDRTHQIEFDGNKYSIYVDSEQTVTEVLVNGQSQDFVCDEAKLSPWVKYLTGIAFLIMATLVIFVDKTLKSDYKMSYYGFQMTIAVLILYLLFRQYRFAYPRKK